MFCRQNNVPYVLKLICLQKAVLPSEKGFSPAGGISLLKQKRYPKVDWFTNSQFFPFTRGEIAVGAMYLYFILPQI